jgi:hypothetical protein
MAHPEGDLFCRGYIRKTEARSRVAREGGKVGRELYIYIEVCIYLYIHKPCLDDR